MYKMKSLTGILLFLLMQLNLTIGQMPEFQYHEIGLTSGLSGQTSLSDMDNDGDLDWISGTIDSVWWFEYSTADEWKKHLIGLDPMTEIGGTTMDVDKDGWMDQVSGITWFRNTGNPREEQFERYETKGILPYEVVPADINGDRNLDVVLMNDLDGLYWYDVSVNPKKKWKGKKIGDGVQAGIGPQGVGDIDQDGDIDIVRSNLWYENLGEGKKWNDHMNLKITNPHHRYPHCTKSWLVDFDGDGDLDLVQVEAFYENCRVAWQEKQDKRGLTWYLHMIEDETDQELQSLCVADFDGDGDLDIFSGGSHRSKTKHPKCIIWENADGEGLKWNTHVILKDVECYRAVAGDVDGDGDIDICATPRYDDINYFLENKLK